MLAPTHSIFGIFLTLTILAVFGIQWGLHWSIIVFAIIGSIIPDIDHPRSLIGRMFRFISIPLERKYGHRGMTHSLFGWAVFSLAFAIILFGIWLLKFVLRFEVCSLELCVRWVAAFSISYFSHLMLDMFNPRGVQMLWPDTGRDVIPRNPKFRPESGSKAELFIFIAFVGLMFLAFPISKYGLSSSLRWLLATPGSAIEEFKTIKTHSFVEFEGVLAETKEPIKAEAEILDVDNKRLVILYKGTDAIYRVYTLSDELAADIFASHVRVRKTNDPIKIERKEFKDKSREYLLSIMPSKALISGVIQMPDGMQLELPITQSMYKTINQKGNNLILSYASKLEIEKLSFIRGFELPAKKDRAEIARLNARAQKIKEQIKDIESGEGLTPLGKKLLANGEDDQKQQTQLAELNSQVEAINVKIEELEVKLQARKMNFSGEVYLRM